MEHSLKKHDHHRQSRMGGFGRRHSRQDVSGYSCDIAASRRMIDGVIENVSANGFKLTRVGGEFVAEAHCYRTVVSGNGKHYKLLAKPCWQKQTPQGLEIGFKVLDAPWEWLEMMYGADGDRTDPPAFSNA